MTNAIRIHRLGGPEVLQWEPIDVPAPGPLEVRVRHTAVGLNYIDIYFRTGLYQTPLPFIPGFEAAGVIEAIGADVTTFKVGERVAYSSGPLGAYCEARVLPADRVVRLPDGITDLQGAAMMLQGMTAEYLVRRTYPVKRGDTILIHAAAGGVGLIVCQWAKSLGATVIGTVGSDAKAELARAHGCDYPIVYTREDFQQRVLEITNGAKVPVVYDSVGRDTFAKSLDCLAPLGLLALFGQASGPVPPFDLGQLAAKGSLFVTRPTLFTYTAKRADLEASSNALFEAVKSGAVRIAVNQTYPLRDAGAAHRDLEARRTTGSTVLVV